MPKVRRQKFLDPWPTSKAPRPEAPERALLADCARANASLTTRAASLGATETRPTSSMSIVYYSRHFETAIIKDAFALISPSCWSLKFTDIAICDSTLRS